MSFIDCTWVYKILPISGGADKICHFLIGFFIGIASFLILQSIWMLVPVVVIALGKEMSDKYIKKSEIDFFDFFATVTGGWISIMLTGLIIGLL